MRDVLVFECLIDVLFFELFERCLSFEVLKDVLVFEVFEICLVFDFQTLKKLKIPQTPQTLNISKCSKDVSQTLKHFQKQSCLRDILVFKMFERCFRKPDIFQHFKSFSNSV